MRHKKTLYVGILAMAMLLLLAGYAASHRDEVLLIYLVNTSATKPRLLREAWVRPVFKFVSGYDLPDEAEQLQGIFEGGHEPAVFIKFKADPNTISKFVSSLTGPEDKIQDISDLKLMMESGYKILLAVSSWQDKLGVVLFDQESIKRGRLIESKWPPSSGYSRTHVYKFVYDEDQNILYIWIIAK
jgi:hypothetical protein